MGSTERSEWVHEGFNELASEITELGIKHNLVLESIGLLWGLVGRTSEDPVIKQLCARQTEMLETLIYEVDSDRPPSYQATSIHPPDNVNYGTIAF